MFECSQNPAIHCYVWKAEAMSYVTWGEVDFIKPCCSRI